MNKIEVKGCNSRMSIEKMPEGCLFYGESGYACMKVHLAGENNSDSCYYVNLRTSFLCKVPKDCMFYVIYSEVVVKTVW